MTRQHRYGGALEKASAQSSGVQAGWRVAGRPRLFRPSLFLGSACLWLVAACEDFPTGSDEDIPQEPGASSDVQISLDCFVDAAEDRFSCGPSSPTSAVSLAKGVQAGNASGVQADVIAGSQDRLMRLTSANVSTTNDVLSADVTVQNLLLQPLATQDGSTLDPEGVRAFLFTGPTNGVEVANADGTATFTSADQPFFQYDELLEPAQISSSKSWEFALNGASTFNFQVLVSAEVPVEDSIAFSSTEIAAGNTHACAVDEGGNAFCWGNNGQNQLGDSTTTSRLTPTAVVGGLTFSHVTLGIGQSCGLDGAGNAYCWGANENAQLGDGTTTNRPVPTPVAGELTFSAISAGGAHTCGLDEAGNGYCWGANVDGQLGDSTITGRLVPTPVAGGLTFSAIAAGFAHTCALDEARNAYCWGRNGNGQLGDSTTTNRPTPTPVAGELTFSAIAGGGFHTCGLDEAGNAYCWGSNTGGQLGDSTMTNRLTPTAVTGGLTFSAITNGNVHTCGLDGAGNAYCWGNNGQGQLGDGATTNRSTPTAVVGGITFASINSGNFGRFTCARTTAGVGHCWGDNGASQLGDGTGGVAESFRDRPVFVASTR